MNRHSNFLRKELRNQMKEFDKISNSKAFDLLQSGQLVIGSYMKVKNGSLMVKCKSSLIPRKREHYLAFTLTSKDLSISDWKVTGISYEELLRKSTSVSKAVCIWMQKGHSNDDTLCGFSSTEIDFVNNLDENTIVLFGPDKPPTEYLSNLNTFANNSEDEGILALSAVKKTWDPTLVSADNQRARFFINQLELSSNCIIQGPPGTGKTTLIGEIVAELLKENKSVLVTAMTNNAIMEVARQKPLSPYLESGNVCKANLTSDEQHDLSNIEKLALNHPVKGALHLRTFYNASSLINESSISKYDYLIIDEASQAFLTTLASFSNLGTKQLWVGDHMQMPPVTMTNEDVLLEMDAIPIKYGFQVVCENSFHPSFMLESTRRFGDRGAEFTSIFYQGKLKSSFKLPNEYAKNSLPKFLNTSGGPILMEMELRSGEKAPVNAFREISSLIKSTESSLAASSIMVLAPFKKTVSGLKKHLLNENIQVEVETVDRIQGKTVGICIYLIPNCSYFFSLAQERFNVATSRAQLNTFIVCDSDILNHTGQKSLVSSYLTKLKNEHGSLLH